MSNKIVLDKNTILIGFVVFSFFIQFINLPAYDDDIGRFAHGYIALSEQGRFLTEWYYLIPSLGTNSSAANIYTFNLIAIALSCALSAIFVLRKSGLVCAGAAMAFLLVFVNPFSVENMSYHVDGIGMMVSFSLAIVAAYYTSNSTAKSVIIPFLLTVSAICMYQISITIFCCMVCLRFFHTLHAKENPYTELKTIAISKISVAFLSAAAAFFILNFFITSSYSSKVSVFVTFNRHGADKVIENLLVVTNYIWTSFNAFEKLLLSSLATIHIVSVIKVWTKVKSNFLKAIATISAPFIILILSAVPTIFFESAVVMPRVLVPFWVCVAYMSIPLGIIMLDKAKMVIASLLIISSIMSAAAHVSSINYLYAYTEKLLSFVESAANKETPRESKVNLSYVLPQKLPSDTQRAKESYPVNARIAKLHFGNKWLMQNFIDYKGYAIKLADNKVATSGEIIASSKDYYLTYEGGSDYTLVFK